MPSKKSGIRKVTITMKSPGKPTRTRDESWLDVGPTVDGFAAYSDVLRERVQRWV